MFVKIERTISFTYAVVLDDRVLGIFVNKYNAEDFRDFINEKDRINSRIEAV